VITEALLPLLARSEDARVINQSSILGSLHAAQNRWHEFEDQMTVGYSTSKAALGMLTLIQAKRLASQGILVAASHPGWVKTDLGGEDAPMELHEGAHTVVHLGTMAREQFPRSHMDHRGGRGPWEVGGGMGRRWEWSDQAIGVVMHHAPVAIFPPEDRG